MSRSPRIAQARVRLATNTLPQTPHRAGALCTGYRGYFRAAQARWYDRGFDACLMEALACRDGLVLVKQQGIQHVWLETDCLELVNLWKKDDQRSIVDPVLKEIDDLRLAFQDFSFSLY